MVVAGAAYGSIGLAGALLFQYTGVDMLDSGSVAEAWASLPSMVMAFTLLGFPMGLFVRAQWK